MAQHRHNRAQDRGELGSYQGPDVFHRCLAARQLAWITQHLQPHPVQPPTPTQRVRSSSQPPQDQQQQQQQDQQLVGLLLPLLLAVTDDPSPSVQRYGQAGLGWLGLTGLTGGSPDSLMTHKATSLASSSSSSSSSPDRILSSEPGRSNHGQHAAGQTLQVPPGQLVVSGQPPRAVRAASLAWHRVLLLDAARRLVVGCEEGSWATALPAATSLVMVSGD
ncbi:hypothetical protein OEZ85_002628 [Tetradesmus obliquus]|uniref:Uncharacterized protein n=1 Tax=Tetradesmus obliquus TaxID=3088 RepID=A0ABY8U0C8_TETOB|nr:hypothetical protein OEZ85_002628 [Tetradesmus obliquus]